MLYGNLRDYAGTPPVLVSGNREIPRIWAVVCAAAKEQVDAASLAVFRIVFGLVGVFIVARFFAYGWIGELYIEPKHHFT